MTITTKTWRYYLTLGWACSGRTLNMIRREASRIGVELEPFGFPKLLSMQTYDIVASGAAEKVDAFEAWFHAEFESYDPKKHKTIDDVPDAPDYLSIMPTSRKEQRERKRRQQAAK